MSSSQPQPPGRYEPPPAAHERVSFDREQLRVADHVVAGGAILYLVMAILPWVDVADYLGIDLPGVDTTVSGFAFSGLVWFAFGLLLLAAAWSVLPAFTDVRTGIPRGWVTVGLAVLGFLLTLIAWIGSLRYGFQIWALLAVLTAAAMAVVAFLALLPELRRGPAPAGRPGGAAQRTEQQAPDVPAQPGAPGPAGAPPLPYPTPRYVRPPVPPSGRQGSGYGSPGGSGGFPAPGPGSTTPCVPPDTARGGAQKPSRPA